MNTIIVVILVLVVLFVLLFFLINQGIIFQNQTGCASHSGTCTDLKIDCGEGMQTSPWGGCKDNQKCCVKS